MNHNSRPIITLAVLGVVACWIIVAGVFLARASHRGEMLDNVPDAQMSYDDFNLRGNENYKQESFKRAASDYSHMIELAPTRMDGYMFRAMAEYHLGAYDKAIADDTKALQYASEPETITDLHFNRGLSYKNKGEWDKAITDFSTAIQMNPNIVDAHHNRAWCYTEKRQYDKAIADYSTDIARDPRNSGALMERGQVYLLKGDYDRALADLDRSIALRPEWPTCYLQRARVYDHKKQYTKALADCQEAIRQDPNNADFWNALGWFQYKAGHTSEALPSLEKAIAINPKSPYAEFNRGLCYAELGDSTSSAKSYRVALTNARPGEGKEALKEAKEALQQHPGSPALKQAVALLTDGAR